MKLPEEKINMDQIELFWKEDCIRWLIEHGHIIIQSKPELTDENYYNIYKPIIEKSK